MIKIIGLLVKINIVFQEFLPCLPGCQRLSVKEFATDSNQLKKYYCKNFSKQGFALLILNLMYWRAGLIFNKFSRWETILHKIIFKLNCIKTFHWFDLDLFSLNTQQHRHHIEWSTNTCHWFYHHSKQQTKEWRRQKIENL